MGLLDGLFGNAAEEDVEKIDQELQKILTDGESVERAYAIVRDLYVFTNKRLILIDKQGVTGKKVEYHSIPYKSISHFSIETVGHFDMESELRIWLSGADLPIEKSFKGDKSIYNVQKALSHYVLE
ncbi:PH domain-containing protein [Clostridium oryzae]|uniref:Bacterial Pleckstrin homology domain-containing protein n=1 Tax=Clostridium oryzae TaxID=1450648 RepID=A0A1V4IBR1_9CLOT|nr:PH domain-containing protein [Clostridium oryzae]OPJ57310.1 hypothetical protein CLORY_41780 [Clostridium oryzae]